VKGVLLLLLVISGTPSGERYFPEGAFHKDWKRLDEARQKWYSDQLKALDEPSLYAASDSSQNEIYRFLWLRTFHHPVAVRIELSAKSATVFVKEADGAGGYKPGKLIRNSQVILSERQSMQLVRALQDAGFWKEPTIEESQTVGSDGARWIFEGVKERNYHVVDRWSPPISKSKFGRLGRTFIDLAQLQLSKDDIY
jgi:hypothetical protein